MAWDAMRAGVIKLINVECDGCGKKEQVVGTTSITKALQHLGWRRTNKGHKAQDVCGNCAEKA